MKWESKPGEVGRSRGVSQEPSRVKWESKPGIQLLSHPGEVGSKPESKPGGK